MNNEHQIDFKNTPISNNRPKYNYRLVNNNITPIVSVITPFFNTGKIFHETAESALRQSFQQWEWIIVNDCSDDVISLEILNQYRNVDPRIKIIDLKKNNGPSKARNIGLNFSEANYCLFFDSDDLLEPTAIEKWFWFLSTHSQWSMVGGYSIAFGDRNYLWEKGFQNNELNLFENQIDHTVMIRKNILTQVIGFDENIIQGGEDWEFWLHCANEGYWGTSIPEILHWYRTREIQWDKWENFEKLKLNKFHSLLKNRYPNLWEDKFPKIKVDENIPYRGINQSINSINLLDKEKKRMLLIVPWLEEGGADKFNLDIIKAMLKINWEISIIATLPSEHKWKYEFDKLTPDIFILSNFLMPADYPNFIDYLITSRQIDVCLISNSEFGFDYLPHLKEKFPEKMIFSLCHTELDDDTSWGGYAKTIVKYRQYIDRTIVVSEHLKNKMVEHGMDENTIDVCYAGIDLEIFNSIQKPPTILFVGRLCREKNPEVMILTFKKLKEMKLAFKAIIVGNGPLFNDAQHWIEMFELSKNVCLLGSRSLDETRLLYKESDIFFLPSEREGIALVLFEAMASKLPVVASNVGGQSELVTPDVGFLMDRQFYKDDEATLYANALAELITNPEKRLNMGVAAYHKIENKFCIENFNERIEDIFTKDFILLPGENEINEYADKCLRQAVNNSITFINYYKLRQNNDKVESDIKIVDGNELAQTSNFYKFSKRILLPIYTLLLKMRFYKIIKLKENFKNRIHQLNNKFGI